MELRGGARVAGGLPGAASAGGCAEPRGEQGKAFFLRPKAESFKGGWGGWGGWGGVGWVGGVGGVGVSNVLGVTAISILQGSESF